MTAQKGYVLKCKNKVLSVAEYQASRFSTYIVGFKNPILARKVHYNMHPEPKLRLERSDVIDITTDINKGLLEVGTMGLTSAQITIDVFSRLYIPKQEERGGPLLPINDGGFHLEEITVDKLYMMPFDRNIGVILPYDLESETSREIVLMCQVIDPASSTQHFTVP